MENSENPATKAYRQSRLNRRKDEYENLSEERADDAGDSSLGTKSSGAQGWRNVRAVMAYYCTLRKIKRNGGVHNTCDKFFFRFWFCFFFVFS